MQLNLLTLIKSCPSKFQELFFTVNWILKNKLSIFSQNQCVLYLGFFKRTCKKFKNILTLKSLYYSIVRTQSEQCCNIGKPTYNIDIFRIEKVQKNFTRYLFAKLNWNTERPTYFVRCKLSAVCCGVRGRALASHTDVRGFVPQCGGRLSSLTC